jgi:hypothetical protein
MIIVDRMIIGGLRFVLDKVVAAVDQEMNDDSVLREELLAAQMRLELGEIDEDEFVAIEAAILPRLRAIQESKRGVVHEPGEYKVTGASASFEGDKHER